MRVRFWGVRGSLPAPGNTTLRYGGNTSCVEVLTDDGTLIVLDCGTGLHRLGHDLLQRSPAPPRGHILIGHAHWDHIQGFPFFAPIFLSGSEWDIYGPRGQEYRLEATLAGQMQYTYFPVHLQQLSATIRFHDLSEGAFRIGSVRVRTHYLNHPALTLGYRIEVGGRTLVYATDHEPHARHEAFDARRPAPALTGTRLHVEDQRHVLFLQGADLLIHDSQYLASEYPAKAGWGHSTVDYSVNVALAGGVKRLVLFHHDPLRADDDLDAILGTVRRDLGGSALDVAAAYEGLEIVLPEDPAAADPLEAADSTSAFIRDVELGSPAETVLVAEDDPITLRQITAALVPESAQLLVAADGTEALRLALNEKPDLLLLDWHMPGLSGPEVCRVLRSSGGHFADVPIVLITSQQDQEDVAAGFAAGVTDFISKPLAPAHLRSRVRTWLLRARGVAQPSEVLAPPV